MVYKFRLLSDEVKDFVKDVDTSDPPWMNAVSKIGELLATKYMESQAAQPQIQRRPPVILQNQQGGRQVYAMPAATQTMPAATQTMPAATQTMPVLPEYYPG